MTDQPLPSKTPWQKFLFAVKFLEVRLRFVLLLVLTALVVGYWDWIENHWERWTRGGVDTAQTQSEFEYYCGMHPYVIRDRQGLCPACGMSLDKRRRGEKVELPKGVLARVQVSPEKIMQAGVQAEPVAYKLLTKTIRSYGAVEADERRIARITTRFPGRIEELTVNAVGLEVKQGDPLARVYSPRFLSASQEYVQAVAAQRKIDADPQAGEEGKQLAATIAASAKRRLLLAGFTQQQLDEILKSEKPTDRITFHSPLSGTVLEKNVRLGDSFEEGATLYTVADLSVLWVQVQLVESDVGAVKVGMPVEVTTVASPGRIYYGNVELIYPALNPENRSVKARLSVKNEDGKLKPGMFVDAVIRSPVGRYGQVGTPDEPKVDPKEQVEAASGAYPLDFCIITKAKLGSMGDPVTLQHEGRTLKFCCAGCIDTFKEDPKKYLQQIDEAAEKAKRDPGSSRWIEGYACAMHPHLLQPEPGKCSNCGCDMPAAKWRLERVLAVPETAVIDTGTRQIVYVESSPGVYDAKAVTLGPRSEAYYPVLSGLQLGDRVAARGSFLIDAETRLNPASTAAAPKEATAQAPEAKPAGGHEHAGH